MEASPHNLLKCAFFGPWVKQPGSAERTRHHFLSLAHWYEAAKFMPAHPDLRDSILFSPSVKEALKTSHKLESKWRADWKVIRHQVLIAGLAFLAIQRPDLELHTWPKKEIVRQLSQMGIPDRFLDACLDRFFDWSEGKRIGTYGAQTAPEGVVGRKMSKLVENKPNWTLVTLCNKKASWRLHDWALSMFIPIRYIGTPQSRTTSSLTEQFLSNCDQVVVFEAKGGKGADSLIRQCRAAKIALTLELYQAEDLATRSLC